MGLKSKPKKNTELSMACFKWTSGPGPGSACCCFGTNVCQSVGGGILMWRYLLQHVDGVPAVLEPGGEAGRGRRVVILGGLGEKLRHRYLIRHSSARGWGGGGGGRESPRRWVGLKQSGQKDKSMNRAETKTGVELRAVGREKAALLLTHTSHTRVWMCPHGYKYGCTHTNTPTTHE